MRAQHVVVHIILLLVNDFARQALRYVLCLTYPSCCRSTLAPAEVAAATGVPLRKWQNRDKYRPMYNAFPGCDLPVVYHSSSEGSVVIRTMKWGLIPAYTKPDEKPQHFRMFNARSETVGDKGVFKRLCDRKRCIVVADGFYEWTGQPGHKVPWYVHRKDGRPIMFAGLYDKWHMSASRAADERSKEAGHGEQGDGAAGDRGGSGLGKATAETGSSRSQEPTTQPSTAAKSFSHTVDKDAPPITQDPTLSLDASNAGSQSNAAIGAGSSASTHAAAASSSTEQRQLHHPQADENVMYTCTMLTCPPSKELSWLHDRMPVILSEADARVWLDVEHVSFEQLLATHAAAAAEPKGKKAKTGTASSSSSTTPVSLEAPLFSPYDGGRLVWHACDPKMNNLKYQGQDASDTIDIRTLIRQGAVIPSGSGYEGSANDAGMVHAVAKSGKKGVGIKPTSEQFFKTAGASKAASSASSAASSSAHVCIDAPSAQAVRRDGNKEPDVEQDDDGIEIEEIEDQSKLGDATGHAVPAPSSTRGRTSAATKETKAAGRKRGRDSSTDGQSAQLAREHPQESSRSSTPVEIVDESHSSRDNAAETSQPRTQSGRASVAASSSPSSGRKPVVASPSPNKAKDKDKGQTGIAAFFKTKGKT